MLFLCQQMLISWTTILSDAFIFLTKIAIEAISLTVMAVEIVPFLDHQNTMYQFTVQTILFDSTFLLPCWVNKPIALSIDLENIFI